MDPLSLAIIEAAFFFIALGLSFKALMKMDLAKHFEQGAIWQIQIIYIFLAIALAYLVSRALINLIDISFMILT